MRYSHLISTILSGLIIFLGVGLLVTHAQGTYTPLAPLPGTFTETAGVKTTNLSTYLAGAIKLLVALGAALAVLFAIIGGTQYVAASINPSAKKDAMERIQRALLGLAIILTSYLLLNSINPKLVQFNFMLPPIGTLPGAAAITPVTGAEAVRLDDTATRAQLQSLGVNTKNPSCSAIGQQFCTSVSGLGSAAISALGLLKGSCAGCSITVTGGTEYWLHSANTNHRQGNSVVDLRKDGPLDTKVKTGASLGTQTACSSLGPAYRLSGLGGGLYVDEGDHWHVCY